MSNASRKRASAQRKAANRTPSSTPGPTTLSVPFVNAINNAATWSDIVKILCTYLDLPDLATRSGLKAVHARFAEYFTQLDAIYIAAERRGMERLVGGVVGVWAKMSSDAILRDKLFQAGLLPKISPLLNLESTRHLALQALSTVTHHAGLEARMRIARRNRVQLQELSVITLSHSTIAVINTEEPPDPRVAEEIAVKQVLQSTMRAVRDPRASRNLIDHALPLLTCATLHFPTDTQSLDGVLPLLVATLRSVDICNRCTALGGLIRSTLPRCETQPLEVDPLKLVEAASHPLPKKIAASILQYGLAKSDAFMTLTTKAKYTNAMRLFAVDHDLVVLRRSLADLILSTEVSILEGFWCEDEEPTILGADASAEPPTPVDIGLPFLKWTDALPLCAKEIRALGTEADLDVADTLYLKFLLIRHRGPEAIVAAEGVTARNPEMAYAYYIISLGSDCVKGLRAVKKGLRCTYLTPFLRDHMRCRAVEHAGVLGLGILQLLQVGEKAYPAGIACLDSALEDAKKFLLEAPPDNRHMQTVLNWSIVLEIVFKGPELSMNLVELKHLQEKLDLSSQTLGYLGYTIQETQLHLSRELIVKMYPVSTPQWQAFVQRLDDLSIPNVARITSGEVEAEDDLAEWLDNIEHEDGEEGAHLCSHPAIDMDQLKLYRCSWCSNPSAVLKKCGGCGKSRYCDTACQKQHWSRHKLVCRTRRTE